MYSTCLFCNRPLGTNETFPTFPVGRRLAFDAAKGRLWVVCPRCERWNLTPLDERWEVIEQAEELYRDTRRRVATDQIGLAKLRDGTELVRIGEPLRPEFAAWRYGDQFGRRRRRQMLIAGAGLGALGAVIVGGAVAGVGIGSFAWMFGQFGRAAVQGNPETVVARVRAADRVLDVRRRHLTETTLMRGSDGPLAIHLRHKNGATDFEGEDALRVAAIVIPHVNRFGGAKQTIAQAVDSLESSGGAEGFMERASRTLEARTAPSRRARRWGRSGGWNAKLEGGLFSLSQVDRLALEMALHEEAERRVLRGELAALERAWRDAEEIAAIADDLLVPGSVSGALARMRGK